VLGNGGHVSFEWPKSCSGWKLPELTSFIEEHNLFEAVTDGCAHGMCDSEGVPHLKSWRVVTSSWRLAQNLNAKRCTHPKDFKHSHVEGSKTAKTAFYPRPMATTIAHSLYPEVAEAFVPSMPVHPFEQHEHVPNAVGPEHQPVFAGIHQLIDRKDWDKYPGSKEAIDKEAKGLLANETWSFEEVVPRSELLSRKEHLNLGRLMTILSIKHFETPELRKLKARIVFRGDQIVDEANNLAILQELKVNPSGLTGINFNLAYGALPNHDTTQSDVVRAYTQSYLNTKCQTWVELPPELVPAEHRNVVRPCVRLHKALYGHPEAGWHWDQRFKTVMTQMGGEHSESFQSSYWFKGSKLLLTLYVDDMVLSGPASAHGAFWRELEKHLEIEPPTPVDRVLGRKHIRETKDGTTTVEYDMQDFCANACDLFESLTGSALKGAATPFVPEGSLLATDWAARGALAENASRILMKTLWLARLSRPDLLKPLSDLTRRVTCWTRADDKRLYRLMNYLKATPNLTLVNRIGDKAEDLKLNLYTDADHASEAEHAQSTSGCLLTLEGPNSWYPLTWLSKKQSATARSTTEAEMISLCTGIFGDALPIQEFAEQIFEKEVQLQCHQDNSAVIQIVEAGYSPKLRHVSKTHRINLSSLYEVFEDPSVRLTYISTDKQCADIFTKALAPCKFPHALNLLQMKDTAKV
jgi:hypothetical protein